MHGRFKEIETLKCNENFEDGSSLPPSSAGPLGLSLGFGRTLPTRVTTQVGVSVTSLRDHFAMVWIPRTADALLEALRNGTLPHESAYYEYKKQLPHSTKNVDIAIDVSAMTVDGGLIIYGVEEDKEACTFSMAPVPLQGIQERIGSTVAANVQEVPILEVNLLRASEEDTSNGYVVVDVPPSLRAPHMVEVKNEHRYYGRHPAGNRRLGEAEVARLYARREAVERDAQKAVDEAIAVAPIGASPRRGDLHLVARPILSDRTLRQRVFMQDDGTELRGAIHSAANVLKFVDSWQPSFADMTENSRASRSLDGILLTNDPFESNGEAVVRYASRLEFMNDGTTRYFRASLADVFTPQGVMPEVGPVFIIRETSVAQIAAHFILMAGQLLSKGNYRGQVEFHVALTGAKGAESASRYMGRGYEMRMFGLGTRPTVPTNDFRDWTRTTAERALNEPVEVARELLTRLLRLIRPGAMPDPLAVKTPPQ